MSDLIPKTSEQIRTAQASHLKEEQENDRSVLNAIKFDVQELTDEMATVATAVRKGLVKKEPEESLDKPSDEILKKAEINQDKQLDQVKQQDNIASQFQLKTPQMQTKQNQSDLDELIAEIMGSIMGAEEVDKKKKKGKLNFEEKLERLAQLESDFSEMHFEKPEDRETVQRFFDNLHRFRSLKNRLKSAKDIERRYNERLENRSENRQQTSGPTQADS